MRLESGLEWNPDKEEFIGNEKANSMRKRKMRKPWNLATS